jgi:hypothetical protein
MSALDALVERSYEVWFDEFELEIGDSPQEKIDEGLATSRFGVVLSERFLREESGVAPSSARPKFVSRSP